MSIRSAFQTTTGRAIGVFDWPIGSAAGGDCSPGCAGILGAEISGTEAFVPLLTPASAAAFRAALRDIGEFRIDLALRDGRLLEMTAARHGAPGAPALHGTIEDVSTRCDEIAAFKAREELCRAVAENSPAMLWMGDETGKCVFLNQALRDFWGVDPADLSTFSWGATTHPDDIEALAAPFMRAMEEQAPFTVLARYRRADGEYRTLRTQANPRFDRDGAFLGMTGVNTDITDQLTAEERSRILMGELNHRTKNILAVVQAIARQTARHAPPEDFAARFEDRLVGLSASNDLLLRNDMAGVALSDLVDAQLAHLRDLIGDRISVEGPPVRLQSTAAQAIGMALHELSTNSLKHGALGVEGGEVAIGWTRCRDGDHPDFAIRWLETGVDNLTAPTRKGFGHAVIVGMVESALGARVDLRFEADGLKWEARAASASCLADSPPA